MKDQIRQKLNIVSISLSTTPADVFPNVRERTMRNVVAIWLTGDGAGDRRVTISVAGERSADVFPSIPVSADGLVQIPSALSLEDPVVVVEGGSRLQASQNSGSGVSLSCLYWDDVER